MAAKRRSGKKRKGGLLKALLIGLLIAIGIGGVSVYEFYQRIMAPNVVLNSQDDGYVYIPTGATFNDVVKILNNHGMLMHTSTFEWLAHRMDYDKKVLPGRYQISQGMSNKDLVTLLRSGKQTPIKVIFNNVRTLPDLAGRVGSRIEADSASLMKLWNNKEYISGLDSVLTRDNFKMIFLPNTYEFYWNTSAEKFSVRMYDEYRKFWTESRLARMRQVGLTRVQVSVIASIVEQETKKKDEMPRVAGVYMNRYNRNWKLEADPTLIYAVGDFTIKRVLNVHKEIDSPYNTYMYGGLPPGPISIPSITALESVINYEKHDYMFFCARADFSGYHAFARTYPEHLANARKFQRELDRRNIKS